MNEAFSRIATLSSQWLGKPISFVVSALLIIVWAVSGPFFRYSDTWQLIVNTATTVLTFLAVFLIQNSQNRDGMAIQAKLDELILASRQARNDLVRAEEKTETEIERLRIGDSRDTGPFTSFSNVWEAMRAIMVTVANANDSSMVNSFGSKERISPGQRRR